MSFIPDHDLSEPVVIVTKILSATFLSFLMIGVVKIFRRHGICVVSLACIPFMILILASSPWLETKVAECIWQFCYDDRSSVYLCSWPLYWISWVIGILVAFTYWVRTRSVATESRIPEQESKIK
jgi:hypothetical protein